MSAFRSADIFVRGEFAGVLQETETGYSFRYDESYLARGGCSPVSLTLPLSAQEYTSKVLFAFFDGLIPEGWLLEVALHNWKIDRQDRFGLLLCTCKDAIGCVQVQERGV